MRTSKYSPEQIAQALRQAESGTPIVDICRKLQVTEQTFFRWRKKFGELGTPEIRELRQLRDENRKLKQLVAYLSLDKTILQESLRKKWSAQRSDARGCAGCTRCMRSPSARRATRAASRARACDLRAWRHRRSRFGIACGSWRRRAWQTATGGSTCCCADVTPKTDPVILSVGDCGEM
jgi:putative transposase